MFRPNPSSILRLRLQKCLSLTRRARWVHQYRRRTKRSRLRREEERRRMTSTYWYDVDMLNGPHVLLSGRGSHAYLKVRSATRSPPQRCSHLRNHLPKAPKALDLPSQHIPFLLVSRRTGLTTTAPTRRTLPSPNLLQESHSLPRLARSVWRYKDKERNNMICQMSRLFSRANQRAWVT